MQKVSNVISPLAPVGAKSRLSERLMVKLAIGVVGYDRLLNWYLGGLTGLRTFRARFYRRCRSALKERAACVAALQETQSAYANDSVTEAGAPAVRQPVGAQTTEPMPVSSPALVQRRGDLKIGVFIPGFLTGKGGAEKVAGKVAEALARSGNTVDLICRPLTSERPAYALDPRVRIRTLFERDDRQIELLKKEKFDLMVGFAMRGFYLGIAGISRQLGVPFIIQECNNPTYIAENLRKEHFCQSESDAYWLRQAVCAHAAGVRLTVPDYLESVVEDVKPFAYAFFNAFEPPRQMVRQGEGLPAKKLICVGAMKNANKNGLVAVRAFCEFASRHPGWSLHLYGLNRFQAEMSELLSKMPWATVVDHGIVHNLDEIYGDAHALVVPSYNEGLPNIVIEGLAYGVPCVGFSDCNGVRQLVLDEETGLLLDRGQPDSLAMALERVSDPELRQFLSANALRFAETHLQVDLWKANWHKLVQNAADGLNIHGQSQTPAAYRSSERAAYWSKLLDSYLQLGEHVH